jgi:hypothetical protein
VNTLSIHQTTRSLMLLDLKTKKAKQSELLIEMVLKVELSTRDGRSSILTKLLRLELRDSTKNSASTSTDHSILDQDSQ